MDHAVDTNVLVAASTCDPDSPATDASHIPVEYLERVFDWLVEFAGSAERQLVLDYDFAIWKEYERALSPQDYGWIVARRKFESARWRPIELDEDGSAKLPDGLHEVVHDASDRKFVAVALADLGASTIANACDTDWYDWENELKAHGIDLTQIIDEWCREQWRRKRDS